MISFKLGTTGGWDPTPLFFVSVAFKRLRFSVSPLEATVPGLLVSVASKQLSEAWKLNGQSLAGGSGSTREKAPRE
jgi:hypothetical protein